MKKIKIENTYYNGIENGDGVFFRSARGVYDLFMVWWSDMGVAEWGY